MHADLQIEPTVVIPIRRLHIHILLQQSIRLLPPTILLNQIRPPIPPPLPSLHPARTFVSCPPGAGAFFSAYLSSQAVTSSTYWGNLLAFSTPTICSR